MKAALIPPIPHLQEFGRGNFHLLLNHLLQDKKYIDHYIEQRKRGAYLVLDNSAHEFGMGDDPLTLIYNASVLKAQEVVVPDVLDDGPATVDRAVEALEAWYENDLLIYDLMPALMYVPQGATYPEWSKCLNDLLRLHAFTCKRYKRIRKTPVIGLSKDYEKWDGGLMRLIDNHLAPMRKHIQVHMLGWGRDLWKLYEIARVHPWIRSTDSAKPFVYAQSRIRLEYGEIIPQYPGRHHTEYFHKKLTPFQLGFARHNVAMFVGSSAGDQAFIA